MVRRAATRLKVEMKSTEIRTFNTSLLSSVELGIMDPILVRVLTSGPAARPVRSRPKVQQAGIGRRRPWASSPGGRGHPLLLYGSNSRLTPTIPTLELLQTRWPPAVTHRVTVVRPESAPCTSASPRRRQRISEV